TSSLEKLKTYKKELSLRVSSRLRTPTLKAIYIATIRSTTQGTNNPTRAKVDIVKWVALTVVFVEDLVRLRCIENGLICWTLLRTYGGAIYDVWWWPSMLHPPSLLYLPYTLCTRSTSIDIWVTAPTTANTAYYSFGQHNRFLSCFSNTTREF
ncbi:unnamed protein product, partial [Ectocarpus sp. 6 AP-2014]